jgi:hypothetical protein
MKTFRFILIFLLLPILVIAFYWEADLQLSQTGHSIAQISIVLSICTLALKLFQIDEVERLREIRTSSSVHYHNYDTEGSGWNYSVEMPAQPVEIKKGNGPSTEPVREIIQDIGYATHIEGLDPRQQPVPKAVK